MAKPCVIILAALVLISTLAATAEGQASRGPETVVVHNGTVTLRDRDSLAQERLPIEGIAAQIERRVTAPWTTPKLG